MYAVDLLEMARIPVVDRYREKRRMLDLPKDTMASTEVQ